MDKSSLGDRMKGYEAVPRTYLIRRMPTVIRLDGKSFSRLTRHLKGFTPAFAEVMYQTTVALCKEVQNVKLAFVQSDEISLLLTDYDELNTDSWFAKAVQKIVSVSASIATAHFNKLVQSTEVVHNLGLFDSRCFNLDKEEVCNYFIWRQQDAIRNATQMLGQSYFSNKELYKKSCKDIITMVKAKQNIEFNKLPLAQQRGCCVYKVYEDFGDHSRGNWIIDRNIPLFQEDRDFVERHV